MVILKKNTRMRKEKTDRDPDLVSQVRVNRSGGLRNAQVRSGLRSGVPEKRRSGQVSGQGVPETWDLTCDILGEDLCGKFYPNLGVCTCSKYGDVPSASLDRGRVTFRTIMFTFSLGVSFSPWKTQVVSHKPFQSVSVRRWRWSALLCHVEWMVRGTLGGIAEHNLKCVQLRNRVGICQRDLVQGAYFQQPVRLCLLWIDKARAK